MLSSKDPPDIEAHMLSAPALLLVAHQDQLQALRALVLAAFGMDAPAVEVRVP